MSATTNIQANTFEEVVIGTQTWMVQNYDFDGTYPDDDIDNITGYGKLYTWAEAMAIDVDGWHLPTYDEIATLVTYIGGANSGGYLKETGTTHWTTPNTGANNSTGFTAVGAGRSGLLFNTNTYFWTSSETVPGGTHSYALALYYDTNLAIITNIAKTDSISVRLIKD